jgi:hypothetical protein
LTAVVATANPERFVSVCLPGLRLAGVRRWVLVGNAPSIGVAYEIGRRVAGTEFQIYVHDDARLLVEDAAGRIEEFLAAQPPGALAGALGSRQAKCLPWWAEGELVGLVRAGQRSRSARPVEEPEAATLVGLLDGVILAQREPWCWTPSPGWHTYDALRSLEARSRGAPVWVHPSLECEHDARYKGVSYHMTHIGACRRLSRWSGLRSAFEPGGVSDGDSPNRG